MVNPTSIVMAPEKRGRGRPKAIDQFLKSNKADPCKYCVIFFEDKVHGYCLACGRAVE